MVKLRGKILKSRLKKTVGLILSLAVIISSIIILKNTGAYSVYTLATKNRDLPIYGVEREDGALSISFDCAWGTEYTQKILETLEFYKVKCTFFMTEFFVEKYPDFVKKISDAGHEIGTHSKTHSYMSKMSENAIREELISSKTAIEKITGKKVELFRPPYGDYDDLLVGVAREEGLYTIQWNVDSLDWKNLSAERIATRILKQAKSGSIILCHNNGLHTAESLPLIFSALQEKGLVFRPIGELIYKDNYKILPNGTQIKND